MSQSEVENGLDSAKRSKIEPKDVDFEIKKPGEHAKASEWRKWKTMQQRIKQARVEQRLDRKEQLDSERAENVEILKVSGECAERKGRSYTVSLAVPGSIITKVQSKELKTYVCGQIARAACLFCVDEIVVYNENAVENTNNRYEDENQLMVKILEYLECPQYLRKAFFPSQKLLEFVGLLNPLDASHHFRLKDNWEYREGVTTDVPCREENGTWVDVGLMHKILVDKKIKPGIRVTVMKKETESGRIKGIVVSPNTPRTDSGHYWGYQVRYADSFRNILKECPFDNGYDLKIGSTNNTLDFTALNNNIPAFKHGLIVFGGLSGLQVAIENDEKFKTNNMEDIFDYLIKEQPAIGSRTVRSEEAILITLATLRPMLDKANEKNKV